ncbi:hypothetical protein GQ600_25447 [Phytophthora cactorum]|nr:hypothetical protein GQ600_25447 [Phytophthora cactorum]
MIGCWEDVSLKQRYRSTCKYGMVESKYYYAGGSCRYMFHIPTKTVPEKLKFAIDSLYNTATIGTALSFKRQQSICDVGAVSPVISSRQGKKAIGLSTGKVLRSKEPIVWEQDIAMLIGVKPAISNCNTDL